jgi:hypothetical protein
MPRPASHTRAVIATLGVILGAGAVGLSLPASAFQASSGGGRGGGSAGGPLNLLSPTFIAPAPRAAFPRGGATPAPAVQSAPAVAAPATAAPMMAAPLPLPRPGSAPRAIITAQNAPAPVAAGVVAQTQPAQLQPAPAEPPQPPLLRPSMAEWPQDDDPSRVIIAGAYVRSPAAPASAAEAIAAAAPQQQSTSDLPIRAVAFAAPLPAARPGGTTVVAMAAGTPAVAAPVLASASSTPVVLSMQGSATTTTMAAPAAGSFPGAQQAITTTPTPARGPVLAALPPDGGARDWPRYVPGARGSDRNLGIAGERVMPDPGVPLTCLPAPVRRALNDVALRFGPVLVRSTHRGSGSFVRTDAWRGSYHRDCRAADFRVSGNPSAVLAFLRARHELGGVKRYRNGLFHIDNGPRRSW